MKNIKRAKSLRFLLKLAGFVFLLGIPYVFIVSRGLFEAFVKASGNEWNGLGIIALIIVYWIPFSVLSLINAIYSFALSGAFNKVALGKKTTVRLGATIPYLVLTGIAFVLGAISAFFCYGIDKGLAVIIFLELIFALCALRYSIKFRIKKGTTKNTENVETTSYSSFDSLDDTTTGTSGGFDALGGGDVSGGFDAIGGASGGNLGGGASSCDLGGLDTFSATSEPTEITENVQTTEPEEVEDELTKKAREEGKKVLEKLYIYELTPKNVNDFIDEVSVIFTDLMFTKKDKPIFKVYDQLVSIIMKNEKDLDYLNKFFF